MRLLVRCSDCLESSCCGLGEENRMVGSGEDSSENLIFGERGTLLCALHTSTGLYCQGRGIETV